MARPGSEDSAWYGLLADRVFTRFLAHVEEQRAAARAAVAAATNAAAPTAAAAATAAAASSSPRATLAKCDACIEAVAVALIEHLSGSGGSGGAGTEGGLPPLVAVAEGLVKKLVAAHPALHWSHVAMRALLGGWSAHAWCACR